MCTYIIRYRKFLSLRHVGEEISYLFYANYEYGYTLKYRLKVNGEANRCSNQKKQEFFRKDRCLFVSVIL